MNTITIIRDAYWNDLYTNAIKDFGGNGDEFCVKMANSIWKCRQRYIQHAKAKAERKVVVIDKVSTASSSRCKAMTMNNKRCPFKASCGDYCKKHKL
jgi:hypothetical protein